MLHIATENCENSPLQASQNIRPCLQLDKRSKIRVKEFLQLNWLNVHDRYLQFIVSGIFKFQNDQCPDYCEELFCPAGENGVITHSSNKKLAKATYWESKTRNPKVDPV